MDSITQILLGSAVAASIAPKTVRKRAVLTGAVLGTLPDLDVFIHYANDIDSFTHHRGFSHSLLLFPLFSLVIFPLLRPFFTMLSSWRLYCLIVLALVTHPLLDSLTSYGTQLFYPLEVTPTFVASVFIIDPLYSSWLLLGLLLYLISPRLRWANLLGLTLSTLYLGLGIGMQSMAKTTLQQTYPETKEEDWFVGVLTASPFCWRGVYRYDDYYVETAFNVLSPNQVAERRYTVLSKSVNPKTDGWQRLQWFSPGTVLRQREGKWVSSDLRMGEFGLYPFEFIIDPSAKKLGQKLSMYDKPFWTADTVNAAAIKYQQLNSEASYPSRKWQQFKRCLNSSF